MNAAHLIVIPTEDPGAGVRLLCVLVDATRPLAPRYIDADGHAHTVTADNVFRLTDGGVLFVADRPRFLEATERALRSAKVNG